MTALGNALRPPGRGTAAAQQFVLMAHLGHFPAQRLLEK
jgi:hypothetical protein